MVAAFAPMPPAAPPALAGLHALAPVAPHAPFFMFAQAPEPPEPLAPQAPLTPLAPHRKHAFAYLANDDDTSYALITGKGNQIITTDRHSEGLEKARKLYKGDFLWIERDGKSYVITDPKILAECQALFKVDPAWQLRQADLEKMQAKLDMEMENLKPELDRARMPGPEFAEQMARLQQQLAELQSDKYKKLSEQIAKDVAGNKYRNDAKLQEQTEERLSDLQEKIGDIQGRIGEIEGQIGERMGAMGEKQGEIGERMGKVGEELGRIGEEQGEQAEKANQKVKSILDQAIKDGTAKPVE